MPDDQSLIIYNAVYRSVAGALSDLDAIAGTAQGGIDRKVPTWR